MSKEEGLPLGTIPIGDTFPDLDQAELEEMNERVRYYETSYMDVNDGICQHTYGKYYPGDFCDSCQPKIDEQRQGDRCRAKGKYTLRSGVEAFRDIIVCGVHKRGLTDSDGWVRHHRWRVSEVAEIDKWIRELKSRGYKVEKS